MENKKPKLSTIIILSVLAAITIVIYVLSGYIFGETSVFNRQLTGNVFVNTLYQKIPALLKSIQIVTIAWLISWGSRCLLYKWLSKTNRGATIVKLINNFIKYIVAIIAIFLILGAWGVDTRTLIASAGILSLIIGLGAQSLISDIIAGVFIVFEGEFQVGDIVIIDGWRGTVDEIGIRATKIIDWQGNIKIVNNSEISTVINQSKELSVTTCVVGVSYKESIPKVELVIKNNLEKIRAAIPEIVEGPYYKGVDSLADSSVNLLFVATVKEGDYYAVKRALNREIKMIFDENNITIPFPQVTVNPPDEADGEVEAKDIRKAQKFAEQQRDVSKTMENINR
ncbi:MAG: mechanosensitive ion channel family protein [Clostridia bacterium]|nr:mechanosensitive ion channel family protein [Clostridia bacterium]